MRAVSVVFLAIALTSCTFGTREVRDGGPTRNVDVSSIPDVIAQPVKRTAAGNRSPYTVLGKTYAVLPDSRGYVREGNASWYGSKFHGRNTSNGEVFNMYGLTAAHKHLPIPTYAEVTNLANGKKITVRINDRGPFHDDRIIDLSWAAAEKLGFSDQGTARVRVVALDPDSGAVPVQRVAEQPTPPPVLPPIQQQAVPAPALLPENSYYQIAALSDRFYAGQMARDVEALTKYPVALEWDDKLETPIYKVLIGPLNDRREIPDLVAMLESGGLGPGFVYQHKSSEAVADIGTF